MTDSSDSLLDRARDHDPAAIGALMAEHLPGLRAFVRLRSGRLLREQESCSDLVQSVCREVLENLERFQHPGDQAFKRWLYSTAMRKIGHRYDYWLAEMRTPARLRTLNANESAVNDAPLLAAYANVVSPSSVAVTREGFARIEAAFEQLSEDHREVIVLSRILGLPHAEIATEMGRTEVAVRSLLFRGLAQLAEILTARP